MLPLAVALSVLGLALGPLLLSLARGRGWLLAALDGATLAIVPTLVLLRLMPHVVEDVGFTAVLTIVAGYAVVQIAEHQTHRAGADSGSDLALFVVLPALAIHGLLDGAGLAVALDGVGTMGERAAVGAALIAHRLPEGLFVAATVPPGPKASRKAGIRLAALAVATLIGAVLGHELLHFLPHDLVHLLVAFGLGGMLRLVVHHHGRPSVSRVDQVSAGVAFVVCLAFALAIPDPERLLEQAQPGALTALRTLPLLVLETAPWVLASLLVAELVLRFGRPLRALSWAPALVLLACLLGARTAFAALVLLALREVALRSAALSTPVTMGLVPSYLVGALLASALEAAVPHQAFAGMGMWPVIVAGLAASSLRMGPAGAALVSALLVHKGAPAGAALALTLLSQTVGGSRLYRLLEAVLVVTAAVLLTPWLDGTMPLHTLAEHAHSVLEYGAGAALALLTLVLLLWRGPRAFLAPVTA